MKKKLITHNGSFHADDIFAAAAISLMLGKEGKDLEIIRTRDSEIIKAGAKDEQYVFDVGGVYDPDENLFDHHQTGGAGSSSDGIEYSSLGLVWKKFGKEIAGGEKPAKIIEKKLVAPIDAWDNGFDLVSSKHKIAPYYLQNIFFAMLPTWKESNEEIENIFLQCVEFAKIILAREIIQAQDFVEAEDAILAIYHKTEDKKIIVLDKNYPFEYVLVNLPEPLFAVYPRKTGDSWGVKAVRKDMKNFKNRKNFPESWAGLRDEELQKISGVPDAMFCHRALFTAVAKSKEGAIKLAQIAVKS